MRMPAWVLQILIHLHMLLLTRYSTSTHSHLHAHTHTLPRASGCRAQTHTHARTVPAHQYLRFLVCVNTHLRSRLFIFEFSKRFDSLNSVKFRLTYISRGSSWYFKRCFYSSSNSGVLFFLFSVVVKKGVCCWFININNCSSFTSAEKVSFVRVLVCVLVFFFLFTLVYTWLAG